MTRAALIALSCLVSSMFVQPSAPAPADPAAGVPVELAQDRAARISNLRYDLRFVVPEVHTVPVHGRVRMQFELKDASRPLAIDFAGPADAVTATIVNGREQSLRWVNEHVMIPTAMLREGANDIVLGFRSADAPLNRNPEFLYALFVPARARQAFPCFDQPDLKGKYSVTVEVPSGWEALSNGAEIAGGDPDSERRRSVRFAETKPISTYLFTFAAGRFKVETAERAGRTFRMLHRETDAAKVASNRDAIFDLHAGAIAWLERYTGIDYPFGKFDFLLVPSFQFGGMEHPGSVFYRASFLFLDASATKEEKLGRASLISHETAHMWFGDLVTMRWFNDVWTKEVFANFMAAKIVAPAFPEIDHDLRFLYSHYPAAYDVDRTEGTNAIRQELRNLNEAGSLYGAIIYQKAPIVMRQLEMLLGEQSFRDGMRDYLKSHAFGNATWLDLIRILDARTPADLDTWSRAWVQETGRPTIEVTREQTDTGLRAIRFTQRDPVPARGLVWPQQFAVAVGYRRDTVQMNVRLDGARASMMDQPPGSAVPLFVVPILAYGDIVLDSDTRAYLLENLPGRGVPLMRGAAVVALWEEMLEGRVKPGAMLDLLLAAVAVERDELNVGRMLGYSRQAYWKFLSPKERAAVSPRLEQVLRSGLDSAQAASLKSSWFNAVRDTATTPATLQWLERVWRKQEDVPGLVLAEPDYITLAQALAVRGVPAADEILDTQIGRTQNPDRKAQMVFVRPALSHDQKTRDSFFATLQDPVNRRRETWVLEAIGYLHHPLRAGASEKHIGPSLQLLSEIQRTGDIFFPKRWMDATLSGHTSASAAKAVSAFVAALPPDYPDRLRRVILSSADDLFRASRMKMNP